MKYPNVELSEVEGFDAPFPYEVWHKMVLFFKRRLINQSLSSQIATPADILRLRENLDELYELGELEVKPVATSRGVGMGLTYVYGKDYLFTLRLLGWYVFFPDYLLVAFPIYPPHRVRILFPELKNSGNPLLTRPSEVWGLPQSVYTWMTGKYGVSKPPAVVSPRTAGFRARRDFLYAKVEAKSKQPDYYLKSRKIINHIRF